MSKLNFDLSETGEMLFRKLVETPRDFTDSDAQTLRDELTKTLNLIRENLFHPIHCSAAKAAQTKTGAVLSALERRHFANR